MRNILILLLLTSLVGCQTIPKVIVKEESKESEKMEAEFDIKKESGRDEKDIVIRYECERGEKPGSPRYIFHLEGKNAKVQMFEDGILEFEHKTSVKEDQVKKLTSIFMKIKKCDFSETFKPVLCGSCHMVVKSSSYNCDIDDNEINPAWKNYNLFFEWLREFHNNDTLNEIEPIFPRPELYK